MALHVAGAPHKADPALLPDLHAAGWNGPKFRFEPFYAVEVEGRYQLLNDNLLDLTHLAFLRGTRIRVEDDASAPEQREEFADVMKSRRYMKDVPMSASAGPVRI